jgi:large subunit ribosomal protein L7Ae
MFVRGKAKLGTFVHKKTATCLAFTKINENDKKDFSLLVEKAMDNFNNNAALLKESEPILGHKSR